VCSVSWLFFLLGCQVIDWKYFSEMTYNVLMGTLNPTHSLLAVHRLRARCMSATLIVT